MQQAWRKIDSLILHLLGLRKVAINSYIYIAPARISQRHQSENITSGRNGSNTVHRSRLLEIYNACTHRSGTLQSAAETSVKHVSRCSILFRSSAVLACIRPEMLAVRFIKKRKHSSFSPRTACGTVRHTSCPDVAGQLNDTVSSRFAASSPPARGVVWEVIDKRARGQC